MKDITKAIARWIDNMDAGDASGIILIGGGAVIGTVLAISVLVHGFPLR